ncbi:head completion/stabilization protein [Escherichia coli]|nr:head completion/stabilization protein [Escherichia coli]
MRQETRFKFNAYLSRVAELNGIDAGDVSKKFTVEPSVTQTLMNTMQESSDFLTRINIVPVSEMKGEKIGIGVTGSIASTTDTAGFTRLADVPADDIDGESIKVFYYERAVCAMATASLYERYRGVDASAKGDKKADSIDSTIDELWRDMRWAVARIQDKPRCIVSQI